MRKLYCHSVSLCNTLYKLFLGTFHEQKGTFRAQNASKKMGASHPRDVSYTSLLRRALTHWKVQANSLLFNNLLIKMDGSVTVVKPKNQKVTISAFDRQTSMQVCEAGEDERVARR